MEKAAKAISKRLQKQIDSSFDRVRRKGHERLTIMIIPHGQEKIFSLQLNWLMITFLAGILLLFVSLTGYAFYRQALKQREIMRLRSLYGINYNSASTLSAESREIRAENEELLENMIEVATIIGYPKTEIAELPEPGDARSLARRELSDEVLRRPDMGPGSDYLPTVYSMKTVHYVMRDGLVLLRALDEAVRGGLGVYSGMPLGRPLRLGGSLTDTSGYGARSDPLTNVGLEFHTGFDTSGPEGTPVYATGSGVVRTVMLWDPGYGNAVVVEHDNGFHSLFAHLSSVAVVQGARITRGMLIGNMGRTGRVTGSHLHYEVWVGNGVRIDPLPFLCSMDFSSGTCRQFNREE